MDRTQAVKKAEALVAQMTVEEAASQLRYDAPAIDRLDIPAYNWWNEALHGVARAGTATSFPQGIGMASSFDPDLIKRLGDISATEGRAKYNAYSGQGDRDIYKGLTFWSPSINIFRDPRWGRGQETYGEDPVLTATMGCAYVKGLQGDGPVLKSAACAKHFAVHSGPEALRHSFNAKATKRDLAETYLPAFEALVKEAKVESVMGAYNRTNDEPCCASKMLMVDTLRDKWGFKGHYVSDCWAIRDFHEHHKITDTPEESAALALKMGCDLNCGNTYLYLMKSYEQGLITEEDIRTCAVRLFTSRYLLGIMEGSEFDQIPYTVVECQEHLDTAREATEKACVLLKNDGLLPLDASKLSTIGVVGPNANSRLALIGNYHGTASRYITVLEGIQDAVRDQARVLYSEGSHLFRDRVEHLAQPGDRISEAKIVAEHADVVVVVVGLDATIEGEEGDTGNAAAAGDKIDLLLPECQRELLDAVVAVGKPTIICLMAGSAIDLGAAGEKSGAVLNLWYPGARGGKTAADILFGKVSPSGKLPVTFYHNDDLAVMPEFTDYATKGRTYRFMERPAQYPFGFGLTYGDVCVTAAGAQFGIDHVAVTAEVENTGALDTEDVVQIYCKNLGAVNGPRNPRLVGFQRIFCPAGGRVKAEIIIPETRFAVADENGDRNLEGNPVLYVGTGQPDARTAELTGHQSIEIQLDFNA